MPELPEVETIRGRLAPLVEGRTLRELEITDPRWCEPLHPTALAEALVGRRVERLDRRGKSSCSCTYLPCLQQHLHPRAATADRMPACVARSHA